jgi:hypothetical protein
VSDILFIILPNVKEHPASSEDNQNNQTDGRGLDVLTCSASSLKRKMLEDLVDGKITTEEYTNGYIEAGFATRELTMDDYYKSKEWCDQMIAEVKASKRQKLI